jgi:hypothetical protein
MNKRIEPYYYLFSFILSLYLVFSIVVEYVDYFTPFRGTNETISNCILIFFIIDLFIQYRIHGNLKIFLKEEWISIGAIIISISLIGILNFFAGNGLVIARKIYIFAKFSRKFKKFKMLTKTIKLFKSAKLGKKTIKKVKVLDLHI